MRMTPQQRGALCGLLAAALFGMSAPVAKRLLAHAGPLFLAGLLYAGAGAGLLAYRRLRPATEEAGLHRADLPKLAAVTLFGGALGPVLMLLGLERVTAVSASLLLNLEAPFTILVAVLFFGDHLGRRAASAAFLIVGGASLLTLQPGEAGADALGVLCLAAACLCWALDNNLTQRLTLRDPVAIVLAKTLGAGISNLILALCLERDIPPVGVAGAALLLGCLSYGASVVLDVYALRLVGAAREAAYFATAPFVGAFAAILVVGERLRWLDFVAMIAMAAGVTVLLRERHGHEHRHEEMVHEHVHVHDDHHRHTHGPDDPTGEPHSHPHRHEALVHDHPHVPDVHHRHRH
jgi:drug/metabolite transporter (DMT)-like permease